MSKAIAFFSNGLGNFVMGMSAMAALASMTDSKTVDICLDDHWRDSRRPAVEDLCREWPVVGRVISWPKDALNENEYDLWFYTPHGAGCDVVSTFLHNRRMAYPVPKPNWRVSLTHEGDHYMEIVRAMGFQGIVPRVEFPVTDDPILDLPRPIIGVCNGWFRTEKNYWEKKGWPHFERLGLVLTGLFGGALVGIGGKGELPVEMKLGANFGGKLTILQTAKVLSQLDLLITTDTGPMHVADMLDVPLIALFGSGLPSKNAPRGRNSSVLISGRECVPCQDSAAFYNCTRFACMESISVGDVVAKAREKLGRVCRPSYSVQYENVEQAGVV